MNYSCSNKNLSPFHSNNLTNYFAAVDLLSLLILINCLIRASAIHFYVFFFLLSIISRTNWTACFIHTHYTTPDVKQRKTGCSQNYTVDPINIIMFGPVKIIRSQSKIYAPSQAYAAPFIAQHSIPE